MKTAWASLGETLRDQQEWEIIATSQLKAQEWEIVFPEPRRSLEP